MGGKNKTTASVKDQKKNKKEWTPFSAEENYYSFSGSNSFHTRVFQFCYSHPYKWRRKKSNKIKMYDRVKKDKMNKNLLKGHG